MSTRDLSLEAKLKHSRKQLYQRTKPMQAKHGRETAAASSPIVRQLSNRMKQSKSR